MNNPGGDVGPTRAYVIGHSDQELGRLGTQARLIKPVLDVAPECSDGRGHWFRDLAKRMSHEAIASSSVPVGYSQICVWSRG